MNPATLRTWTRLGSHLFAVGTIVRQLRNARRDGDALSLLDAVVNALAVVTAALIVVRELRERSGDAAEAMEDAPL
jgi:hypothetical protein